MKKNLTELSWVRKKMAKNLGVGRAKLERLSTENQAVKDALDRLPGKDVKDKLYHLVIADTKRGEILSQLRREPARRRMEYYRELAFDRAREAARRAGGTFQQEIDYRLAAEALVAAIEGKTAPDEYVRNTLSKSGFGPKEIFDFLKETGVLTESIIQDIINRKLVAEKAMNQEVVTEAERVSRELAEARLSQYTEVAKRFGIEGPANPDDVLSWALEHREQIDEFLRERQAKEKEAA